VRLATSSLAIIVSLLASQVHAKEISTQPLMRADCDRAGMTWNDTANVCAAAQGAEAFVEALFAQPAMSEVSGNQPLTREDCARDGMAWNDNANVCGATAQAAEAMSEPQDAQPEVAERLDCESAGMSWNDTTNVCGEQSQGSAISLHQKERTRLRPPSSSTSTR
jgi:hypothetical protein